MPVVVCASCLHLPIIFYRVVSLLLMLGWKLILMWMWRQPVVIITCKCIWRTAVLLQRESATLGGLLFALNTFTRPVFELSIIYIKNDIWMICRLISITVSDMLNVQYGWRWQFRTCGPASKQTWSRLSIAIIKHYWTQHLLTLQRSQLFPHVRKMGTI